MEWSDAEVGHNHDLSVRCLLNHELTVAAPRVYVCHVAQYSPVSGQLGTHTPALLIS